jgi:hypothetical protein
MFRLDEMMDLISTPVVVRNDFGFKFNILDAFANLRGLPVVFDVRSRPDYRVYSETICGFVHEITTMNEHVFVNWYVSDDPLGRVIADVLLKITPTMPPSMTPISQYLLDFVNFQIHMRNIIGFRLS